MTSKYKHKKICGPLITPEKAITAAELYKNHSMDEIARIMAVSVTTVRRLLDFSGVRLRTGYEVQEFRRKSMQGKRNAAHETYAHIRNLEKEAEFMHKCRVLGLDYGKINLQELEFLREGNKRIKDLAAPFNPRRAIDPQYGHYQSCMSDCASW